MSSVGDLQVNVRCDASELTTGMTQTREQIETTTTTIQVQDASWTHLGVTSLGVLGQIAGPVISLVAAQRKLAAAILMTGASSGAAAPPTFTFAAAVNFLLSPIVLTLAAIALLAGAIYYFSGAADDATTKTKGVGKEAEKAAVSLTVMQRAAEEFGTGLNLRKSFDEAIESKDELESSWDTLLETLKKPFSDAAFEVGKFVNELIGANEKADESIGFFGRIKNALDEMGTAAAGTIEELTIQGRMLATGETREAAEEWLKLRDAFQEAADKAYHLDIAVGLTKIEMKNISEAADEAAARQRELAVISGTTTVQALDKQSEALKANIQEMIFKGKYDKEATEHAMAMGKAIAAQRIKIESEPDKDYAAVTAALESARKALFSLANGQDEAAIATLRHLHATDAQIQKMRDYQNETKTTKYLQEMTKQAEDDLAKSIADAGAMHQQGTDKITALKDQIDLLTGSATAGEIAMRELSRAGFRQDQIDEIGTLTDQLDKLKEKDKKTPAEKKDKTSNKAALTGTSEAASIMLRGLGGDTATKHLTVAKQQLAIQKQQLAATKANVAPALMVAKV